MWSEVPAGALLTAGALLAVGASGVWAGRALGDRAGWSPDTLRLIVVVALVPWIAQHVGLVRVVRSRALNPLRDGVEPGLLVGDVAAPVVLGVAATAVLLRPRTLRWVGATLPLLAAVLTWWVTLPLYAEAALRGWIFLPEPLASDWLLAWYVGAGALLASYAAGAPGRTPSPAVAVD